MLSNDDINQFLSPVRRDLLRYVPGIRELSISQAPTEAHVLEEWARHLNDLRWWNYPLSRPWPAPIEYEQAFHEASDRNEFLFALRRLLDALEPILFIPDEDNPLFLEDNQAFSEAKAEEMRRYGLRRARIIAKRMGKWLQLRQRPADVQFLEALERILLVPDWDDQSKPPGKLTVAYYQSEHDGELHFDFLLTRLREDMPRNAIALNTFQRRVKQFLNNPLAKLTGAGFDVEPSVYGFKGLRKALIDQFPQYTFVDGVSDVTDERVGQFAKDFWSRFTDTISWRIPWAKKALEILPDDQGGNSIAGTAASGSSENRMVDVKSFLLDDYILPKFTRHQIDIFLSEEGLIKKTGENFVAISTHKPGIWAAVRRALEQHKVMQKVTNELAAVIFSHTYTAGVSEGTMNYKPAERSATHIWKEKDTFYYGLLESLAEAFPK